METAPEIRDEIKANESACIEILKFKIELLERKLGRTFSIARELMAPDSYELFVRGVDKV